MSDRAATEKKFNGLLQTCRAEIIPVIVDDWKNLSKELQDKLSRLNNFFCGLHGLVHIAETVNTSGWEVEALHFEGADRVPIKDQRFRKPNESAICRTIRTACNLFAYGGDAKTSCHSVSLPWSRMF